MTTRTSAQAKRTRGLAGLARDTRGNTLAMMAAAMIPVTAIAGSAVDTARLYVVKVRLQQACDAGVLAGRKFMESSNRNNLDRAAADQANAFFNNNFRSNWMQAKAVSFTPTKTADQQVAGTATATVAMTVMKMFAAPDVKLNVVCEARFDVADADIMFVLDTTGSMACEASDTNSNCANSVQTYQRSDGSTGYFVPEVANAKIKALRAAVLNFWDTMKANADPTTNLRYGFVPYSANVNVGRLIPASMLYTGSDYTYAARRLSGEQNDGNPSTQSVPGYNSSNCASAANLRLPGPDPLVRAGWNTDSTAYRYTNPVVSGTGCNATRQRLRPRWTYGPVAFPLADYVAGRDVINPTKLNGEKVQKWRGCIEERETRPDATFDISNLPMDLDPDATPTAETRTMWKPAYPDVLWYRLDQAEVVRSDDFYGQPNGSSAPCGQEARRLAPMSRSDIENYLSPSGDFRPNGGTYHDVGMIWGARLLSPNGVFRNDTAAHPGRNAPNRHIIFMTDGDMAPTTPAYSLYGIELSDRRVTGGPTDQQRNRHNSRFVAECQAARSRNIEVWVIAFGSQLNQQLRDCATQDNNHIFFAEDDDALETAFTRIAKQIAMLRVSK